MPGAPGMSAINAFAIAAFEKPVRRRRTNAGSSRDSARCTNSNCELKQRRQEQNCDGRERPAGRARPAGTTSPARTKGRARVPPGCAAGCRESSSAKRHESGLGTRWPDSSGTMRKQPFRNLPVAAHPAMLAAIVSAVVRRIVLDHLDIADQSGTGIRAFDQVVAQQRIAREAAIENADAAFRLRRSLFRQKCLRRRDPDTRRRWRECRCRTRSGPNRCLPAASAPHFAR